MTMVYQEKISKVKIKMYINPNYLSQVKGLRDIKESPVYNILPHQENISQTQKEPKQNQIINKIE